ncbi:MAG: ribose 5-phosphate isomerase A [Parachlamydiaceae bacterium]
MNNAQKNLAKQVAAQYAVSLIKDGMVIGLGSGTTTAYFIEFLGKRCQSEQLNIKAVATSQNSQRLAELGGIKIINPQDIQQIDMDIDGADEIDEKKNMIKGGGGALVREKIVAYMSREMLIIVDEEKLVSQIGSFPLPVEMVPFGFSATIHHLNQKGFTGKLRNTAEGKRFITDNGNYIYDIYFKNAIDQPVEVEKKLKAIPGIVDTGFFIGVAGRVIIGYQNGTVQVR